MASEYTIGATNPVFITLIDIFCVIAFAIPLLCKRAIIKFSLGVALVGLLLFLPTGTFSYWNGWLLMGILFAPMFLAGILMMLKNPGLLQSRLDATPAGGQ